MSESPTLRQEVRALLPLAAPLALAQAGQALLGVVDTAVAGRLSPTAQGAIGLGNGIFFAVSVLGMGVMMALDPFISQAIGAGERARARALLWQGVWLAGLVSLALAPVLLVAPWVLEPAGVEPELARQARVYLYWRLPMLPSLLLFVALRAWLQGVNRPGFVFAAVAVSNVVNFGLDWALMLGAGPIPSLGVTGAALATVASSWVQVLVCVAGRGRAEEPVARRPNPDTVRASLRVGLPIGLQMSAETGVFVLAGVLAGTLGTVEVAAHQVAITWSSLTFCFAVGVGQAASTRVGWALGAKDVPAARRAGLASFLVGAVMMAGFAGLFLALRYPLARLSSADPAVVELAATLFLVTAVFQLADGAQAIGAGALRGAADTRFAFVANVVGHWAVGLPIAAWLGLSGKGSVLGLWWGLCAGLVFVAIALYARFTRAVAPRAAVPEALPVS